MHKIIRFLFTAYFMLGIICASYAGPEHINTDYPFNIETIDMAPGTVFTFNISAKGTFWVDWGDDSQNNPEIISRENSVTDTTYQHTFTSGGRYVIKFGGDATGYSTSNVAAIKFDSNANIAGIYGSLGQIFHTIGDGSGTGNQPCFYNLFHMCVNITSKIPPDLFSGLHGAPSKWMFRGIFDMSVNSPNILSGTIPETLFADIHGPPTKNLFRSAFFGCGGLIGPIPENLFAGIQGAPADTMFYNTFNECFKLSGNIPAGLFSGIQGKPAKGMFNNTFNRCSSLTGYVPPTLFSGISGKPASDMFANTFNSCTGLEGYVPYELFSNITGVGNSSVTGFNNTFANTHMLSTCPDDLEAVTIPGTNWSAAFCKGCTPGFYETNDGCMQCTDNSTCTSETDFTCFDGYYKDDGKCNTCPDNAICNDADGILCDAGYYLENKTCMFCPTDKYCNNNTVYECPQYAYGMYYPMLPTNHIVYNTNYLAYPYPATDISKCTLYFGYVDSPLGKYMIYDSRWDTSISKYRQSDTAIWLTAGVGRYLSTPESKDNVNGYQYNNECTNGPVHSVYTGPGDIATNNCPWRCDDGYYRDGDTCAVCPYGMICVGGTIVCPEGSECTFTCDAGYYYDGAECSVCEPGYYCPGDNEKYACAGTTYTDTYGATECIICPNATNFDSDNIYRYGYFDVPIPGNIHDRRHQCYVELKSKVVDHGLIKSYICYIDTNADTYGVSSLCQTRVESVKCDGGYYMNPPNNNEIYLDIMGLDNFLPNICIPVGEKYYSPNSDWQRYECPGQQITTGYGAGADQAEDCGVIWHIGDQEIRLRSERRTDPRLCVQINDDIFFGDMTPVSEGAHGTIRTEVNGIVYSVYNADLQ